MTGTVKKTLQYYGNITQGSLKTKLKKLISSPESDFPIQQTFNFLFRNIHYRKIIFRSLSSRMLSESFIVFEEVLI